MNVIYSWKTKKVETGYQWKVLAITPRETRNEAGSYADTEILKSGITSSRAKAKGQAQRICRSLKHG